jgi:hypothetical protein
LDFSATSDAVSAVFKKIFYLTIAGFKVAKWAKYKLLNLHANHLISTLAAFVFVPSVFGKIFLQLNLEWYRQKLLAET